MSHCETNNTVPSNLITEIEAQAIWSDKRTFLVRLSKYLPQSKVQYVSSSVVVHDIASSVLQRNNSGKLQRILSILTLYDIQVRYSIVGKLQYNNLAAFA